MPRDRTMLQISLAVLFGCLYWFVLLALQPYVLLLVSPMVNATRALGITEHATFKIVNLTFWTLFWGLVSGLIFGLPLGYLVRPHWLRAWGIFVIVVIVGFLFDLAVDYGIFDFFEWIWNFPGTFVAYFWSPLMLMIWGSMLVFGLFMWLGTRLRPRLRHPTHVAP